MWRRVGGAIGKAALFASLALGASAAAHAQARPTPAEPGREIVVSIPDRKLALVEAGRVVRVYAVAVGAAETPTPAGEFRVVNRVVQPTYYRPGVVIPPGPANPLGTRWLGLDLKGYGIHGTNEPDSVGQAASAGCMRLRNADAEELFELVRPGDRVRILTERSEELALLFGPSGSAETAAQTAAPAAAAEAALGGSAPR